MEEQALYSLLKKSALFGCLDEDQLAELGRITQRLFYQKSQLIFSEGTPATGFILLTSGRVNIVKYSEDGKEQILHSFGPNQPVGEVAVFLEDNYPANCVALTDVEAIFIKRSDFIGLIKSKPQLALNLLAILAQRIHLFNQLITRIALDDAPDRLAKYFLGISEISGKNEILLPLSKGELARMLGMSPETFSRVLTRFKKMGLIEGKGRQIKILDQDRLRSLKNLRDN